MSTGPTVHVTITFELQTRQVGLESSPAITGNRVLLYGLLAMGQELVHRLGDEQLKQQKIVMPDLGIFKGLKE